MTNLSTASSPRRPIIDIDEFLDPIGGANPSGRPLIYEGAYDRIRQARMSEDDAHLGDWQREIRVARWDEVFSLARESLLRETKDLQIAAWMAEALTKLHDFAGLSVGFRLLKEMQDRFWDTYYPEVEDGDLESRTGPALFLNASLPTIIKQIALTDSAEGHRYSYFRWQESLATENARLKDPVLLEQRLAEGKLAAKNFEDAVAQTPRVFYEHLAECLQEALDNVRAYDASNDRHFGQAAPTLVAVRGALEDCQRVVGPILKSKRLHEADPEFDAPVPQDVPGPKNEFGHGAADHARSIGQEAEANLGLLLIEFRGRAQELADAGNRLMENRQKYAELQVELSRLDQEYKEIASIIGKDEESLRALSKSLGINGRRQTDAGAISDPR